MPLNAYQKKLRIAIVLLNKSLKIQDKNKSAQVCLGTLRHNSHIKNYCTKTQLNELKQLIETDKSCCCTYLTKRKRTFFTFATKENEDVLLFFYPFPNLFFDENRHNSINDILTRKIRNIMQIFHSDSACQAFSEQIISTETIYKMINFERDITDKNNDFAVNVCFSKFIESFINTLVKGKNKINFTNPTFFLTRIKYQNYPFFTLCLLEILSLAKYLNKKESIDIKLIADDVSTKINVEISKANAISAINKPNVELAKLILNLICKTFTFKQNDPEKVVLCCELPYSDSSQFLLKQTYTDIYLTQKLEDFFENCKFYV